MLTHVLRNVSLSVKPTSSHPLRVGDGGGKTHFPKNITSVFGEKFFGL